MGESFFFFFYRIRLSDSYIHTRKLVYCGIFLAKSKTGHFFLALEYHDNMRSILFCKGFRTFFRSFRFYTCRRKYLQNLLSPDTTDCPRVLVKTEYFKRIPVLQVSSFRYSVLGE